jgi:hypothetical protein
MKTSLRIFWHYCNDNTWTLKKIDRRSNRSGTDFKPINCLWLSVGFAWGKFATQYSMGYSHRKKVVVDVTKIIAIDPTTVTSFVDKFGTFLKVGIRKVGVIAWDRVITEHPNMCGISVERDVILLASREVELDKFFWLLHFDVPSVAVWDTSCCYTHDG